MIGLVSDGFRGVLLTPLKLSKKKKKSIIVIIDTGEEFLSGVNDTVKHRNYKITLRIFEKIEIAHVY
jgi:hypothetical protein